MYQAQSYKCDFIITNSIYTSHNNVWRMTQKNLIVKQFNWTQMADGTSSIITSFSWKKTKNVQSFCRISNNNGGQNEFATVDKCGCASSDTFSWWQFHDARQSFLVATRVTTHTTIWQWGNVWLVATDPTQSRTYWTLMWNNLMTWGQPPDGFHSGGCHQGDRRW